ncbi:MAG: UvrB/UvrC motif-containing protein [Saccharofermentans sp.]|nr:UvrB/UvrC motif-containing protein [Saccharofermentans sp.]
MKCSKCGATIGNSFVKVNGMLLCDNCARDLKIDEMFRRQTDLFSQAFPSLDVFPSVFSLGSELDFSNTKIRCPRCGTTLRDIESGGQLGCIECYNTFNESIMKNILKLQGSSEYMGRKPGETSDIEIATSDVTAPGKKEEAKAGDKPEPKKEKAKEKEDKDILETLRKADFGTVSDELLEQGMKKAAEAEDYDLAVKLRDELKSRKEGN